MEHFHREDRFFVRSVPTCVGRLFAPAARVTGWLLVLAVAVFVAAGPARAQSDAQEKPPLHPDLARIVERGTLLVGQINENIPLIFEQAEDGTLSGFDVELTRSIARRLGVEVEFVRTAESYDDVVLQVAADEVDLGISYLSRAARQASVVLFTNAYLIQKRTLLINRRAGLRFRAACPSVAELLKNAETANTLGVQDESSLEAEVEYLAPDARPRAYEEAIDLLKAVHAGEIAISLQGEFGARLYLDRNPAARIHLQLCEIGEHPGKIAIAVPPGRFALLHWLMYFWTSERSSTAHRIC